MSEFLVVCSLFILGAWGVVGTASLVFFIVEVVTVYLKNRKGGVMVRNQKGFVPFIALGVIWGIAFGAVAAWRFAQSDRGAKLAVESRAVQEQKAAEDTSRPPYLRP